MTRMYLRIRRIDTRNAFQTSCIIYLLNYGRAACLMSAVWMYCATCWWFKYTWKVGDRSWLVHLNCIEFMM